MQASVGVLQPRVVDGLLRSALINEGGAMGAPGVIRPCAFCFVPEDDRVLIARMRDPDDGSYYYRPLGGGIEFGESGEEAVRREIREELGVELGSVRFLGFLENRFEMRAEPYHELCLIFVADPDGWSIDRFDGFVISESIGPDSEETAIVRKIKAVAEILPLHPEGTKSWPDTFEPGSLHAVRKAI